MIPDEIKKWHKHDPLLQKVYPNFIIKKEKKETATVRRSLTRRCSSNETEKKCLYIYMSIL